MPSAKSSSRSPVVIVLTLAAIAATLLLLVWQSRGRTEAANHPAVGQRLAVVQLEPLTWGATPIAVEQLQGKVTLINFWGPWCEHCLRELPHLVRLREKFSAREGVQFLFVSCSHDWQPNTPPAMGWSEDLPSLQKSTNELLAQREFSISAHYDPQGKTRQAFAGLAGWQGYPTTLLLDRDGVIRYVSIGYTSGDEYAIEEQLRKLLDKSPSERGT